jgi:O-antigen ligase
VALLGEATVRTDAPGDEGERADLSGSPRDRTGSILAGVVIGGGALVAMVHIGARAVEYGFPVVAVAAAVWMLLKGRRAAYVEFVLWLWILEPEVRRIVDFHSTYHSLNPVMLSAPVAGLVGLVLGRHQRNLAYRDSLMLFGLMAIAVVYAFLVGILHGLTKGATADLLQYGGPAALGFVVLSAEIDQEQLRRNIRNVAVWGCLIVGGYGLVQFFLLPHWDAYWMIQSGITTAGRPFPLQVRVFSTLDTAGPLGEALVALILLAAVDRRGSGLLRATAVTAGVLALGLSQVRAAWISLGVGVVLLLVAKRIKVGRMVGGFAVVLVLLLAVGGPILSTVGGRIGNSVAAGTSDTSFTARVTFQTAIAPSALRDLTGNGLGSSGTSTKLSGGGSSSAVSSAPGYLNKIAISASDQALIANFDSGLLEILFTFGSVAGLALLFTVIWVAARSWRRAKHQDRFYAYAAAALVGLVVSLVFTNTLKSADGAWTWMLFGLVGRAFLPGRSRVDG